MRWFIFVLLASGGACYALVNESRVASTTAAQAGRTAYYTVSDRLDQVGYKHRPTWAPLVHDSYPPKNIRIIAFKDEKKLEVWQFSSQGWQRLKDYRIRAASGGPGPKLRQGDYQVPEGFYRITELNPNSAYHLSMRVNYPNDYDRNIARMEERSHLGGDIFIHGNAVSAGCIALGDFHIEELFVLVADTKQAGGEIDAILLPGKPNQKAWFIRTAEQPWVKQLYADMYQSLASMGWQDQR